VKKVKPATVPELSAIAQAMPERYRTMVLLAAWCALRQGELFELRRKTWTSRVAWCMLGAGSPEPMAGCMSAPPSLTKAPAT
jgi:integrase